MMREIVRFSPASKIDGGGEQHITHGQPLPIRLDLWAQLGPRPWYAVDSSGPRSEGCWPVGIATQTGFRCAL